MKRFVLFISEVGGDLIDLPQSRRAAGAALIDRAGKRARRTGLPILPDDKQAVATCLSESKAIYTAGNIRPAATLDGN